MTTPDRRIDIQRFDRRMATDAVASDDLGWHEPTTAPFALNGFPWFAVDHIYRRMPVSPAHPLPEAVDGLANHTAGGQIRFRTDARDISVRVDLRGVADMHHMPSTGQCGFDCYVGAAGSQRYAGSSIYDQRKQSYQARVFESSARELRDVTLYFPLYQGVDTVWIGLDRDAALAPPQPWRMSRPVVIYGTSITQGGCASRPGMAYTNILSRRLQAEVVNLGFSGSGRGEPEVAHVISGIPDPACLVLDFEANCQDIALFESRLAPCAPRIRRCRSSYCPSRRMPGRACARRTIVIGRPGTRSRGRRWSCCVPSAMPTCISTTSPLRSPTLRTTKAPSTEPIPRISDSSCSRMRSSRRSGASSDPDQAFALRSAAASVARKRCAAISPRFSPAASVLNSSSSSSIDTRPR